MAPRGSRRTITYNLTSASSRSAFEHGLDFHDDFDDEDATNSQVLLGSSPGTRSRPISRRSALPIFNATQDRAPLGALLNGNGSEKHTIDLINLLEVFPDVDQQLVEEVFSGCDYMFDRALDMLSELQTPTTSDAIKQQHNPGIPCEDGPGWPELSEDLKGLILGFLPARAVAMAAATCKDFARRVKSGAINARVLTIPHGLSLNGIIGMVAGHPNAHTVSLARWSQQVLSDRDYLALLTAISNGSRSSRRNTPVESISFKGWACLTDGNVMTLCSTLQHLKEVDLTDCSGITDAALTELSKYQRMPNQPDDDDDHYHSEPGAPNNASSRNGTISSGAGYASPQPEEHTYVGDEEAPADCSGTAAVDGEDFLFEMEAGSLTPEVASSTAPDELACAVYTTPSFPSSSQHGRMPSMEEEGEEQLSRAMLDSLAQLAASPPTYSLCASPALGGSSSLYSSSPPSYLMAPERALRSQMKSMMGSHVHQPPHEPGSKGSSAVKHQGWVGAWDRSPTPQLQTSYVASASHQTYGRSSPGISGTSPISGGPLLGRPPRLSSAQGPGLRSVLLAGCSQVSAEGVRMLLAAPGRRACLESLDISRCQRISRQALLVPPTSCLKVLKCAGCQNLHEVVIQLPAVCPLTELHLNNCKQLSKLVLVAPNLKLLHVGGCKNLSSISLRCPQLTQLLANLCFRWSHVSPEQWQCPRLHHLNLFGARYLETASLHTILQQSLALKHLNINGCNTLSEVYIPSDLSDLSYVDANSCKGLVRLRLAGASVKEVLARSCPRLQEVTVESQQLANLDLAHCARLQQISIFAMRPGAEEGAGGELWQGSGSSLSAAAGQGRGTSSVRAGAPTVQLPRICVLNAELMLLPAVLQQIQRIRAARRATVMTVSDQPLDNANTAP
ncbi:hypothetical protein CEUSTIGMA_g529.t1 [Chlamydomonas eustigma]|uniref:CUE domain-containing protein n=1 Tax=Chlamydomonas eustigma TaxID=1157962 RepID=A0A250WQV4_9CHLO|nr:hypothetical protein CEUSTIGMA_g529.t1 [Chlamydomonas eustigma]|eukprot:GAX73076.1 hypothetical protein CEUSTIGMA_g529.t1 [Chlamydomonas eustigma]